MPTVWLYMYTMDKGHIVDYWLKVFNDTFNSFEVILWR